MTPDEIANTILELCKDNNVALCELSFITNASNKLQARGKHSYKGLVLNTIEGVMTESLLEGNY